MNFISYFQSVYWREPVWLLLTLQPIIMLLLKKIIQKNTSSLYVENKLQQWVVFPSEFTLSKQILSKNSAYLLAWLLFSIALAGPRTLLKLTDQKQITGANIMLIVDLSPSMKAMDLKPNRLHRVKNEIYELLEKAKKHRIGITVFSARPHLLVPLTSDHEALLSYIETIDKLSFPTLGSNPTDAILFAQNELKKVKGNPTTILLSDGDFSEFTNDQVNALQKENIPLYILGVGTAEGEAIPLKNGTWLKHKQQYVISKMNVDNMAFLAKKLKGNYSPVYDDNSDWNLLYDQGVSLHNSEINIDDKQQVLWSEKFAWFLIPAIFLFIISLSAYRIQIVKNITIYPAAFLFFSLLSLYTNDATALEIGQTDEQKAYRAYINKEYLKAEQDYKNIDSDRVYHRYLGQANSAYKMGHYLKSIQLFSFATLNAKDDMQRAKSLYNLGNSYFRTGNFTLAINTYNDSLRYEKNNKACLYNIKISTILKKNLEQRLKEKQRITSLARQGKGPSSSNIDIGVDISENTSVSMGSSKNKMELNLPLPELPNTSKDIIQKLVISGLNNIKLANQNMGADLPSNIQSSKNIDSIKAQQHLSTIHDSQHLLWKRLFEIEEGFPAPVTKPRTVPGIKPW